MPFSGMPGCKPNGSTRSGRPLHLTQRFRVIRTACPVAQSLVQQIAEPITAFANSKRVRQAVPQHPDEPDLPLRSRSRRRLGPAADRRVRFRPPALSVGRSARDLYRHRPHHPSKRKVALRPATLRLPEVPQSDFPRDFARARPVSGVPGREPITI